MRRSIWTRVLAILLVISMLAVPVSAASNKNNGKGNGNGNGNGNGKGKGNNKGNTVVVTKPVETEDSESVLTLVEDASTVDNGAGLRASTYSLTSEEASVGANAVNAYSLMAAANEADTEATTTVKYFPVTMYNYDQVTMRNATNKLEIEANPDATIWNGMYFSGGSPDATSYTSGGFEMTFDENNNAIIPNGEYVLYCSDNEKYVSNSINNSSAWSTTTLTGASDRDDATVWTITKLDDGYYTIQDPDGMHMNIIGRNASGLSSTAIRYQITKATDGIVVKNVDCSDNYCYLNGLGGTSYNNFGGWERGSAVTISSSDEKFIGELEYAEWNFWNKKTNSNANGDLIYTGLVQSQLVDDQIVFNVPEGGIFNNDTSVKDIYEYVGLPFVLDSETGVYSFDSDANGAYFEGTPQSGSIDEFGNITAHNLHFAEGAPQPMPNDVSVGDHSTNAFLPYNNSWTELDNSRGQYTKAIDYHFGMRADLPFSMTPNGRVKSTDDESAAVTFTFSGDDDVWVFIDGHLVIDLGGIHNRLDATIDFAANTITYSEENGQDDDNSTASYNDPSFSMTQQLFTADGVEGVIPMSRDAFALDPDHEMQVFYLERGEGTSNCRIEFNLPMNDTVLVTKDATRSWSQAAEDKDLELNPDDEDAGVDQLTAAEQAIINNIDFGFTLYKKTAAADAEFEPVANTNFYLVGRAVEGIVINQTDENGHFYVKNGQSAKFITEIPTEGVTYYVVEDKVPDGFVSPDFNFAGEATYDYSYTDGTTSGTASAKDASEIPEQIIDMPTENEDGTLTWAENKSYEVTVKGSIEANDSIEFICSNYLDAELPNPTALTYEDIIVIDYGLPVNIDPLHNDVFRGDNIEIVYFGNDNVTLTETIGANGVVTATWAGEKEFHSGSVVLNEVDYAAAADGAVTRDTFTYTLNEQLTEVEVITYIIKVTGQEKQEATNETLTQYDYALGKIYIVPATVMYYEENFSDLVTFTNNTKTGNAWGGTVTTNGKSDHQEPGVVGTPTDSIYGSDVAYLNDSFDSNGTSYYGDTTNGAIKFEYTFTGTGTSIFARTSATTGYLQIKLYEGTTNSGSDYLNITYRDTYWKDQNSTELDSSGTLYNIPIYTEEDLPYGTYTVVATVAKAGTKTAGNDNGSGKDFWLDGIRIMQPLNEDAENFELTEKALGAYATDGESNIDTVTLRNKLITDNEAEFDPELGETEAEWPFVVMTDINGEIVLASEYVSIGPKEEVYLYPGQSVSFAVKYWHTDGYRMHMGMKAPFGNGSVKVGKTTYDLKNATDCYYDITGSQSSVVTETDEDGYTYYVATYTFTATDKIVSLTNIKVTGNYEFVLVEKDDIIIEGGEGEDGDIIIDGSEN